MQTHTIFYCYSKAVGSSNLDEGSASFSRQKLRRRVSYERFTARSSDHMVESKQAHQEDGSSRKSSIYIACVNYLLRGKIAVKNRDSDRPKKNTHYIT